MARKTSKQSTQVAKQAGAKPVLLSGGNPQIAKADGDAPVQAYIAAMPGWKSDLGRRLDDLIVRTVPNVRKAVRWNSPWYGLEGQGWFVSYHVFTRYVKVTFLNGASLQPVPPGSGKDPRLALDRHLRRPARRGAAGDLGPPVGRPPRLAGLRLAVNAASGRHETTAPSPPPATTTCAATCTLDCCAGNARRRTRSPYRKSNPSVPHPHPAQARTRTPAGYTSTQASSTRRLGPAVGRPARLAPL